jgi:hypothetical protein
MKHNNSYLITIARIERLNNAILRLMEKDDDSAREELHKTTGWSRYSSWGDGKYGVNYLSEEFILRRYLDTIDEVSEKRQHTRRIKAIKAAIKVKKGYIH